MSLPTKKQEANGRGDLLASVDARTNLAGTNKMELLLFKVNSPETYGINVFKVKEVIPVVPVTAAPEMPKFVMGMASLRGQLVPVVNLIEFCGYPQPTKPPIILITEFSRTTQAFLVESVEVIVRISWDDIEEPPIHMQKGQSKLTGVTRLADGRLVSILDVEQVLHVIMGDKVDTGLEREGVSENSLPAGLNIFFADDSAFARAQLQQILDTVKVNYEFAINGRKAWERLNAIASEVTVAGGRMADTWPIVITDLEMPEMDGFMLTRMIKGDKRFEGVKVLIHSSMSGSSNMKKGMAMGADGFLEKFNPAAVVKNLQSILADIYKER